LIVRGLNYYPHDLEAAAESAWPALRPGCAAAFALDGDEKEEVAIVCEYDANAAKSGVSWDAVVDAIRAAIGVEFELGVRAVVLVGPGQVPKTPSGKVQRGETRRRYLAGELEVLHAARSKEAATVVVADMPLETAADLSRFITSWLSERFQREITGDTEFAMIGLDSVEAVRLLSALGELLGRELGALLVLDYPTADLLAEHLVETRGDG
jgi:acyl carrier protein